MKNVIYANARASAATRTLLGKERLFRIAEAASAQEAVQILAETGFGGGRTIDSPLDYETLIRAEEAALIAFVKEVSPSEKLTKFLLAEYDFHNAEAVMRAKYLKTDVAPMLAEEGLFSAETLKEKIFADDYSAFPAPLARALHAADELFVSGKADGKTIGSLFRRALYEEREKLAAKDALLSAVASAKADAANIAAAFRSRDFAETQKQFVPGGTMKEEELKILCEETPEVIRDKFRFSKRKEPVYAAAEDFSKSRPLVDFERMADGWALKYLKAEKYNDEGIRPFLSYFYYKIADAANVRIAMSCLLNGVAGAEIKERMREAYER